MAYSLLMLLAMKCSSLVATIAFAAAIFACTAETGTETSSDEVNAGEACELATYANTFCPAYVDPVCGCDGNTYNNTCEAARVVTSSTPGPCGSDAGQADGGDAGADATDGGDASADAGACKHAAPKLTFCPAYVDPVCGCDGSTYNNACEAARVVTSSTPGACD